MMQGATPPSCPSQGVRPKFVGPGRLYARTRKIALEMG